MMRLSFEMALVYLKQGRKIRRNLWIKGVCLKKVGDAILYHDETQPPSKTSEYANFDDEDVLALDWEVVE